MTVLFVILAVVLIALAGYFTGRQRAELVAASSKLHSQPGYHGAFIALWTAIAGFALILFWVIFEPWLARMLLVSWLPTGQQELTAGQANLAVANIVNQLTGGIPAAGLTPGELAAAERYERFRSAARWLLVVVAVAVCLAAAWLGLRRLSSSFRARNKVEFIVRLAMIVASAIAILTTFGIVFSLLFEALRFFARVPVFDFLFGLRWSPQTAIRADQVGSSGAFGAIPLIVGTLLITAIAMLVAVPIGLFSAVYMSEYAGRRMRSFVKPVLEILAGIPTVVYGFFAALVMAPTFRSLGESMGIPVSSESALAAGVVMGIMIIPFISSLSDDVMNAVPQTLRDGAYALGANRSETVKQVILPAALPGIVGAVLLAVSRAIGETMIVVMAAGLAANLTANPLEAVTTVTVQIATLLVGDQEFESAKTLSAFALGLLLFAVTLALNFFALRIVQKYREKYD
ncbi:MAG: phosphate ABC transporter permease subunit PstC [Rhodospirillales bacterium]|nr:phosphate ABC transporter permease subunit PstC [Rhodospirillales bacterium]